MNQASHKITYNVEGKIEIRQFADLYSQNLGQTISWYALITIGNF